ncbi:MAG: esterase family protein [Bacteroidetes bacterium]|nr:esterase family protein [Bacteroidota bacterium]
MKLLISVLLSILTFSTYAARVDTILVHSTIMNKNVKCVVIQPTTNTTSNLPVIYLLHGHSGSYAQWPTTAPQLSQKADQLGLIFVSPDGGYDSWYFDSPVDSTVRYETFMTKELLPYIDSHYPTIADRAHRAITGLSMGGHGALFLSIRHKDLFGAAGATSGGVDFRPFPNSWNIKKDLGTITEHPEYWDAYTVVTAVDQLQNGELKLIIDCGTSDFFLTVNRQLHQKLLEKKIDHDYIERPGGHNGAYWRNSIDYQILFFWKFFQKLS